MNEVSFEEGIEIYKALKFIVDKYNKTTVQKVLNTIETRGRKK